MSAVIFDLDGVLVDSEPLWQQGFADVINAYCVEQGAEDPGLTRDDMERFHGGRVKDTVKTLVEEQGLAESASPDVIAELTDRVVADAAAQFTESVAITSSVDVVRQLQADGTRLAVASSSAQRFIESVVERLGIDGAFEVVQSALGLEHGKPHPEVYQLTLQLMGLTAAETLAIEDSVAGVQSALAAGLAVIWLTPQPAESAFEQLGAVDRSGVKLVTGALRYEEVRALLAQLSD